MLDLIIRSLQVTEKRLVRRVARKAIACALAVICIAVAFAWGTVAVYFYISQWVTPVQAGLLISGSALILGALSFLIGSIRRPRKRADNDLVETLVAALSQVPEKRRNPENIRTGSTVPEAALIAALIGAIVYGKKSR